MQQQITKPENVIEIPEPEYELAPEDITEILEEHGARTWSGLLANVRELDPGIPKEVTRGALDAAVKLGLVREHGLHYLLTAVTVERMQELLTEGLQALATNEDMDDGTFSKLRIDTYEEPGLLAQNFGIVVRIGSSEFKITIEQSRR